MAKTATLNIRTDPIIKAQAEKIYQAFGITLTDAVNIFLRKSLRAAMQETEDILAGRTQAKRYTSARELFDDLDKEILPDGEISAEDEGC